MLTYYMFSQFPIQNLYFIFADVLFFSFVLCIFQNADATHMDPPGERVIATRVIVFAEVTLSAEHVTDAWTVTGI